MSDLEDIFVIIPALDEEETIAAVIQNLQQQGLVNICVVDNGSCDHTPLIAAQSGATVVEESRKGYGQACWCGLQTAETQRAQWILFCDADGSDDLSALPELLALRAECDFILGNRRGTVEGRSQLTPVQNFGNWLATRLIRLGWHYRYEDLGPLRLIRTQALARLEMADRGFGWTVEMQAKAAAEGLRICERPVNYFPRQGGRSKIAGTFKGSVQAGQVILTTLAKLYWQQAIGKRWQQVCSFGQTRRVQQILLGLSSLLMVLGSVLAAPHGDFLNQPEAVPLFWQGSALMCAGFVLAWCLRTIGNVWFWLVTLVPRLVLLAMHPGDDIWRYLWEGHIQNLGFNPYLIAPDAVELLPFRFDWWWQMNHPHLPAIYPPVTQLGFRLLAAMATPFLGKIAPSVLLFKSAFVAADLSICWLLSRRFGHLNTLLYAWNPLVIYSFAGGGHYDSWFLLPLVAAWLGSSNPASSNPASSNPVSSNPASSAAYSARLSSAWGIGLSIATKWMSLPVLAFLAWQQWRIECVKRPIRAVWWALAIILVGCLPIAIASLPFCQGPFFQGSSCPIVPADSPFVNYGRSAALLPQFVQQLWPGGQSANWIYALPLGAIVLWNLLRSAKVGQFTERYLIALMLLSPIIHAWYFTWLVPFSVASRNWGTRWVSLSAFIYFALPHGLALGKESWILTPQQHFVLWFPFVLGLLISRRITHREMF